MRATRRRTRQPDPLASAEAVRAVLSELRRRLPDVIPADEKKIASLLRAAVWAERHPESTSSRGRRSKWAPRDLALAATTLREILARETSGPKALRSFVDHYLRIPSFPEDVREALERGEINLFEAEQLARVTAKALGLSASGARTRRRQVVQAHLAAQESGQRLRVRIDALLNPELPEAQGHGFSEEILAAAAELEAELADRHEEDDPDPAHLFFELLTAIAHAVGKVEPGDLTEEIQREIFGYGDSILLALQKLERRKAARV